MVFMRDKAWIIVTAESQPDKKSTGQAEWPWKLYFLTLLNYSSYIKAPCFLG